MANSRKSITEADVRHITREAVAAAAVPLLRKLASITRRQAATADHLVERYRVRAEHVQNQEKQ